MHEREIRLRSGSIELSGTLALPGSGGPFPAVLFLTGSGQVDRNENHKRLPINAFREIAHHLTRNGVASLRYDKRGVGQSGGDFWSTGFHDGADDALAVLRYLRNEKEIAPQHVFLLGHSEGAFVATKLAGGGADVAGIILLSGGAQSGEAVLKWQAREVAKTLKGLNGWLIKLLRIDVLKAQQKQIDKIKQSDKDWFRIQLVAKINAKWFREFMAYDPTPDLARINVPVLAIAGTKDIQVDPGDLERMAHLVKAPFEGRLIQDMTHLLRIQKGEASVSNYKEEVKRPIAPEVLDAVSGWLEQRMGRLPPV
jgi:pimeloyl-ACP methyl ester carboxylesterase